MKTDTNEVLVRQTAQTLMSRGQVILFTVLALGAVAGLVFRTQATLAVLVAAAIVFFLFYVGLKLLLHIASGRYRLPTNEVIDADDPDLPVYTVFVPLYKEANMLPSLVRSLNALHYPKDKLQVLLLLEEDDVETRAEAVGMELPAWYEIVVIPDLPPRGKPKALNMGLARAKGAFSVIFDAEDRPDPDQLLKAISAFRAASDEVACVQARLFFWNQDTSWITRFYWTEYVVHYEYVLPGLAKIGLIPPLGGTSNHFRTEVLRQIAIDPSQLPPGAEGVGGWDPWNVTEDAELAGALRARGHRVLIIDSTTREEATAKLKVAGKQRKRWIKGYLQTGLVYTRTPIANIRRMGFAHWFFYNLLMLGTPLSLWLSPIFWGMTITYFVTRSQFIEGLFPPVLFYSGVFLLVAGNLLLFYQLVMACLHREGYGSVKYLLMTPVWWTFTSFSAYWVLADLARPSKRHHWDKTEHGHDLQKEERLEAESTVLLKEP